MGERFDYTKGGLWDAFFRVINCLCAIAKNVIKWPTWEEERRISNSFKRLGGIENIVGAVDGSYVPMKAPKENAEVYKTRKCNYAMTLQAIAIPTLKFIDTEIAYPGSVHDGRIFRNSLIYSKISENREHYFNEGAFIIGDKAYPLLNWCIPPYINRGGLNIL